MFTLLAVLSAILALTIITAGSLSILRNPEKKEHFWFFIFTALLSVWIISNFVDSNIVRNHLTSISLRIDFVFALLVAWSLLQFVAVLTGGLVKRRNMHLYPLPLRKNFRLLTTIINAALIIAILGNLVFESSIADGKLSVSTLPLSVLYDAAILYYFGYGLFLLGRAYLKSQSSKRQGLNIIWVGVFLACLANIATNIIFPEIISDTHVVKELNILGYIGILALVISIYVAITVKKLFDIRLVVARSLAYVLLVAFLAVAYVSAITFVSVVISGTKADASLIAAGLALTLFSTISFQYFRRFFTNTTKKIFFRDSYDTQQVLNDLNILTTSNIDLTILINKTTSLLRDNVKSKSCIFVLRTNQGKTRVFGSSTGRPHGIDKFFTAASTVLKPHKPLMADSLEGQEHLKAEMGQMDAELIVPLYVDRSFIGFIMFGTKLNGVAYTQQDMQLLSIAADSLSVAIQNALRFEEIENFNLSLQQKVEEATHKLRHANDRLKALDETKDDFISMASHQLRTPLTSIKGYLSMILEGDAGDLNQTQKDMISQAFTSSQRMVYLIADLLNVSRLKTGKFIIEKKPVNLADVIEQELAQVDKVAEAKDVKLMYDKPKDFPELMIDDTKTRQVIMNLVDNAIYYTPSGGEVTIELLDKPSNIEFKVTDNGIGVPKSEQPHLFTKFYRAGNARKARPDGTGLGLFMAKKVVVSQGGAILFDSKEGKGSTFGFTFSKAKLDQPVEQPKPKAIPAAERT